MDKIALLHKMVSGNPTDSNTWYLLGLEYSQQRNIGEAIKAYSEALKYCDDTIKGDIIDALSSLSTISGTNKVSEQQDDQVLQDYIGEEYSTQENDDVGRNEEADEIEAETGKLIPLRLTGVKRSEGIYFDENRKSTVSFSDVGGLQIQPLPPAYKTMLIHNFDYPLITTGNNVFQDISDMERLGNVFRVDVEAIEHYEYTLEKSETKKIIAWLRTDERARSLVTSRYEQSQRSTGYVLKGNQVNDRLIASDKILSFMRYEFSQRLWIEVSGGRYSVSQCLMRNEIG